jgi:carboxypeptidase Q
LYARGNLLMQTAFHTNASRALAMCIFFLVASLPLRAQEPARTNAVATNRVSSARSRTNDPIARIRDEGLNHSQVMQTLSYLSDVIGPRLTGSPNLKRANEWTRDKLTSWGLTNAHLEAWGPFGRGWSLKRFSAQVIEPQTIPLIAAPKAWTPGFSKPISADVVYIDAKTESDLEKYKGKLKGVIVLASPVREVKARFEPLASRLAESNLLRLANAGPSDSRTFFNRTPDTNATPAVTNVATGRVFGRAPTRSGNTPDEPPVATNATNVARAGGSPRGLNPFQSRLLSFLTHEEPALIVSAGGDGDGGTLFVAAAAAPETTRRGTNSTSTNTSRSVWSTNAPAIPAQMAVATEDYNRLVRMIRQGEKLKMAVDLQVQFHTNDVMAYNTVAEIPGSDLDDEVVMIGAHMDSWHSGTGATDNGAGVAATMEAVRILKALNLQPRRTVRIGLWTGEEQGLLGSKAYVARHFGYTTNITNAAVVRSPGAENTFGRRSRSSSTNASTRKVIRQRDYEKISAYYNLDNGTGKIRGVYMQGNETVRPLFRKWLQPFADLGAETLTAANTGGTDHLSFDAIGVPGFQFIQDPIDYWTRTHHSNEDVYDRIQADDMKQAATIMAAFLYNTAMLDEKLPRKVVD